MSAGAGQYYARKNIMKRILFTIARWIGRVVLAAAVLVLVLVVVFDMRLEFNGGLRPGVVFGDPDEHYADLEADRLGQSATPTLSLIHI